MVDSAAARKDNVRAIARETKEALVQQAEEFHVAMSTMQAQKAEALQSSTEQQGLLINAIAAHEKTKSMLTMQAEDLRIALEELAAWVGAHDDLKRATKQQGDEHNRAMAKRLAEHERTLNELTKVQVR